MTGTTAATQTLADFLLARIAEDEAVARETLESHDPLDWSDFPKHLMLLRAVGLDGPVDGPSGYASVVIDPVRVLAECEAKKRLIKYARSWRGEFTGTADTPDAPSQAGYGDAVLRVMAQVYKDHPDFNAHDWLI